MPTKKEKPKVVSKSRFFTYIKDDTEYTMTEREKAFCDAYLKFGAKGVDAVYEAGYEPKNRRIASALAYENLIKPHIFNYINLKYDEFGFNDDDVHKEHLFLLKQDGDLGSKAKAIDMFYKKRGNYAPEKIEHTITAVKVVNYKELDGDNTSDQ